MISAALSPAPTFTDALRFLVPPPRAPMADWLRDNFRTDEGRVFAEHLVPWVTAPNGPCDAADNPKYRRIWLQWAARMFKTQFGQALLLRAADTDPSPCMCATQSEDLCKDVLTRTWAMAEACPTLRHQVPVERLRSKKRVKLANCTIHGAWARGKSKLADKTVRFGHANEIDKWETPASSSEGEPLQRFLKRLASSSDSVAVLESTPSVKGASRIERGLLSSTNCRYWVPCPSCGKYQELVRGDGVKPPGVFWEHGPDGRSDPDLALRTARYVCGHCESPIDDSQRPDMMWRGVWVPEGCGVDHDRAAGARDLPAGDRSWLTGEAFRDSQDYGSQISSIYAMFHGWGEFARRWVQVQRSPKELHQYINEDLAESWQATTARSTWQKLVARLATDIPQGVVPAWAVTLTAAVDRQQDIWVWSVVAWGPEMRCHIVAYGDGESLEDITAAVLQRHWQVEIEPGATAAAKPVGFVLVDSGFRAKTVYAITAELRRRGIAAWPCKGSNEALNIDYKVNTLGPNTSSPGVQLIYVDTMRSQEWIEAVLHSVAADAPNRLTIHRGSEQDHADFAQQLLNEASRSSLDATNHERERWDRLDATLPNDWRDTVRYAYVAALLARRAGAKLDGPKAPQGEPEKAKVISRGVGRRDGRAWLER